MDLKQRLRLLRRQGGTDARPLVSSPTAEPVAWRMRRLTLRTAGPDSRPAGDAEVARLLGGTPLAEGLIAVDHQVPLSQPHGKRLLADLLRQPDWPFTDARRLPPEGLIFMDTETTGLAGGTGTLAFLLGLGRIVGDRLWLRQLFLTAFRGEAALLDAARQWIDGGDYLVTFNGKSFDAPLMATRYRLAGLRNPFDDLAHVDLFHPVRRAFGRLWSDCRLQTAERHLLRVKRHDDLPAYQIPEAWFAFVRHGHTRRLPGILTHNRTDLLSMVALLPSLAEAFVSPGAMGADVVAVARYWLQRGDEDTALKHLQAHRDRLSTAGLLELARLHRRRQAWAAAVAIWQELAAQDCLEALERLAKYHEHVQPDLATALCLTRRLQQLDRGNPAHARRAERLQTRLARRG